jgi:dihydrolipoamide dehydrogenase
MECDVAVLGGGPGGYTAAIRAAQLGAKTVCIEREAELGGTCLRIGCIPTKAWVQTAFSIKEAEHTFAKLGVQVGEPRLDFATANDWKAQVVHQMTHGVASLFKANGVEWVKGTGRFKDAHTIAVEGARTSPSSRRSSRRARSALAADRRPRLRPVRRLRGSARPDRGAEAARHPRRRHHRLRVRVDLPALRLRGDDHRDAAEADPGRGRGRLEGAREAVRQAGIALNLEKQCTKVEESAGGLTVYFGDGETVECDLMLVAVGRGPTVENLGLEQIGVEFDKRKGIAADEHRRTTVGHIYAVGDCAGYWQLAHTAFREGEVAAENAAGHDAIVDNRAVPRRSTRPRDRRRRPDRGRGSGAVRR